MSAPVSRDAFKGRLARFVATASRRPWVVLWFVCPISWQLAVTSLNGNWGEEGLALLLSVPEIVGILCVVALLLWELWTIGTRLARRERVQFDSWPWFARIAFWFGAGYALALVVAR